MNLQFLTNSSVKARKQSCTSGVVLSASSMMMTLCFAVDDNETVEAKFFALFLTVSRNRPSSDPLMTYTSTPSSLQSALATVVLPQPGGPERRRFGTSPLSRKSWNVFFTFCGRIQSSIVCGRYFSTQIKSLLIIN